MDNNNQNTKECPMCAETVKERAKICRFCRFDFEPILSESHLVEQNLEEESLIDETVNNEILNKETFEEAPEEALDKKALEAVDSKEVTSDDRGWEAYNSFLSTDTNSETSEFEVKYDVWITSKYNEKVCNEIIKITKWDTWVAGKFLLELENYGNSMKLVEKVDINSAERIKNSLEQVGAKVSVKSNI